MYYVLAFVVGVMLGALICGAVYLGRAWFVRVTSDGADLPPGAIGAGNLLPDPDEAAGVDLSDPAVRLVLGLSALRIYLAQGGDAELLRLVPLDPDDHAAVDWYATRRRRGY